MDARFLVLLSVTLGCWNVVAGESDWAPENGKEDVVDWNMLMDLKQLLRSSKDTDPNWRTQMEELVERIDTSKRGTPYGFTAVRGRRGPPLGFSAVRGKRGPPLGFSAVRGRRGPPLGFSAVRGKRGPPRGFSAVRGKRKIPTGFSAVRGKKSDPTLNDILSQNFDNSLFDGTHPTGFIPELQEEPLWQQEDLVHFPQYFGDEEEILGGSR